MQRQLFICEAIKDCKETSECCPHKQPHIKDERCVPKECRFGPADKDIDCVLFDPSKPQEKKPVEVPVTKTVATPKGEEEVTLVYEPPVKKEEVPEDKPEPAQRPVTLRKKPGRKASK
jgi:hypothetical protein